VVAYFAALDASPNIFNVCVGISCFSRNLVFSIAYNVGKDRWFGVLEALLATGNCDSLDRVHNCGTLGRNFDVSLVAEEKYAKGDDNSTI
jgi:hypothetical protein